MMSSITNGTIAVRLITRCGVVDRSLHYIILLTRIKHAGFISTAAPLSYTILILVIYCLHICRTKGDWSPYSGQYGCPTALQPLLLGGLARVS